MIYALRTRFGISAREAWTAMPSWEIDVLLAEADEDDRARKRAEAE